MPSLMKRAIRISVGWRHTAKLLFSPMTTLLFRALKRSTFRLVRVPLNRRSFEKRKSRRVDRSPYIVPGSTRGGGYQISELYILKPAKFGSPTDVLFTASDNIGKQIRHSSPPAPRLNPVTYLEAVEAAGLANLESSIGPICAESNL